MLKKGSIVTNYFIKFTENCEVKLNSNIGPGGILLFRKSFFWEIRTQNTGCKKINFSPVTKSVGLIDRAMGLPQ